jgi:hypothetical protein
MNWVAGKKPFGFLIVSTAIVALIAVLSWWQQEVNSAEAISLATSYSYAPGEYDQDIYLEITSSHPDAQVYFTLDGRIPDPTSDQLYTSPIHLPANPPQVIVVRSLAALPDGTKGPAQSATYFMNLDTKLPKLSLIVDPDDLWHDDGGIYVNYLERGREWERPVTLTYVTGEGETGFQLGAGLRVHGELTRWFSDKKSLRLYFRDDYGPTKLNYPIFGADGSPSEGRATAFDVLILHNGAKDLRLFRNPLADRLAAEVGGFSSRSQPALLFINGEPWGIYNIREPIDQRFLQENYAIPSADLSDTPNIRSRQSEEQRAVDLVHWEHFMEFVESNDLSDPANYEYLKTQIDLENFVDYYLLEMFIGNTDWPHHNVHQFRPRTPGGRWEWIVWDSDRAFDRVDRQMVQHVLVATHRYGERMELLINKLLANPEFRNLFITRAADLLNTSLGTATVQTQIADLVGQLNQDIQIEENRWDISGNWEDTLDHIYNFAEERPDMMRQHFIDSLGLEGTSQLTFNQAGDVPGWVVVNKTEPQELPWTGTYFQGSEISLQAIPPDGYGFAGWEGVPNLTNNDEIITLRVGSDVSITPRFELLSPDTPQVGDVTIESYRVDDEGEIEGDWFELQVNKKGGVDLRGWRVTDNDHIEATDEGSIIFADDPLLKNLSKGSKIRVIATRTGQNSARFIEDGWQDGVLVLYIGNDVLDTNTDPWFNLGTKDNLLLLAPGSHDEWNDDIPIDLWSGNKAVRPSSFAMPPKTGD